MYYLIFIIGTLLLFIPINKKVKAIIFIIPLTLIACFRYGVGPDYFGYNYLFNSYNKSITYEIFQSKGREEIGFRILATIFNNLGLSYQLFLALFAIVTLLFIYILVTRYSVYPLFSLLIFYSFFYFVWIFSGIRQGLTLAISALAVAYCFKQKKHFTFIIIILFLCLFHMSVIVVIPLYFVSLINWKERYLVVLFIISVVLSFLPINFVNVFGGLSIFANRVKDYQNETTIADFQSLVRILFGIIALIFYKKVSNKSPYNTKILTLYILSLCLYFVFKDSELIAARLSMYGRIFEIILIPLIISVVNKKYIYITIMAIYLFLCIYLNKELVLLKENYASMNNDSEFAQYTNIFNKDEYGFEKQYFYLFPQIK